MDELKSVLNQKGCQIEQDSLDLNDGCPNDEIWYETIDGNVEILPPIDNESLFGGVSIVSNTYSNGKGIIKFSGDVTSIGDYALCFYELPQPIKGCSSSFVIII